MKQRIGHHRPGLQRSVAEEKPSGGGLAVTLRTLSRERHHGADHRVAVEREGETSGHEGEMGERGIVPSVGNELAREMHQEKTRQDR